jgi:hypothetical protein
MREIRTSEARARAYSTEGRVWDGLGVAAMITSRLADISIDFLSGLTGTTGRAIKYGYTAIKDVGKNTLVAGGGRGLREGIKEAVVDIAFSEVTGRLANRPGGKIPLFSRLPPNAADVVHPGTYQAARGMGDWTVNNVKETLKEQAARRAIAMGGAENAIVRDRLRDAAFNTAMGQGRNEFIRDPIKSRMGIGGK